MSLYLMSYEGAHEIDAPIDEVWRATTRLDELESWFAWLKHLRISDETLRTGTRFEFVAVSPLPYKMSVSAVATEVTEHELIQADIFGDLVGLASLRLEETDTGTIVTLKWDVELMQTAMRLAARVSKPLLRWGQDWAVKIAVAGARRHLESRSER